LPEGVWRVVGLGGSVATFVIAIASVLGGFDPEHLGPQHVEYAPWVPAAGVSYFVGVDGISLFLVLLTTGLVPLTLLSARRQVERSARSFVFFVLLLESGLLGVFLALNAALFFLAWQATLVPVFFLIGIWGGSRRVRAATRFLAVWGLGSALLLVALLSVAGGADGVTRFDMLTPPGGVGPGLLEAALPRGQVVWLGRVDQAWLFLALLVGFGLTVPIVPLHGWLLDAESEAPMSALTLLTAVGLKMGAYGMLRFALPLCPDAVAEWGPFLYGIALVGIVYGSLLAAAQTDLRRLVAWWTLAQLGFVLLGTFSLEQNGLTGSVIAMLSHGLTAAALLLLVGAIAERRGSYEISALGGLARPMPVFSAFLGLAILAAMGTPTLSGFVGDLLVVVAGFQVDVTVGLVALVGWVIGAGCLAWAYRRIALGPVENPENRGLIDLDWRERGTLLAVLIPIIWIGLYPNPVLRRIEPSVLELLRQIDERRVVAPVVVDEGSRRDALARDPTPSAPQGEPA
jgi:NADH-quinone oxidoreductase subunit M